MMNKNDCKKIADWAFNNVFGERVDKSIAKMTNVDSEDVNKFINLVYKMIDELPDSPEPCPFCGSNDGVTYIHTCGGTEFATAECKSCKTRGPKAIKLEDESWDQAEMNALEMWNTRAGEE